MSSVTSATWCACVRTTARRTSIYIASTRDLRWSATSFSTTSPSLTNHLAEHPDWYNALTHNCTTAIRGHVVPYTVVRSWPSWKLLVNGCLDDRLYEVGAVDRSLPFPDLKARSINERARAADHAPDFSKKIREGLPDMSE